jgi:hypothetical protein
MIAVASSGRRFAKLARYLARGRDDNNPDRVAWVSGRNLVVDRPDAVARIMQATAAANPRATHPVYHVAVAFHPDDVVSREAMERVANRLLRELGLGEHQALIVAHNDTPHAHMHIMVNRIDPETGKAWDRWQDRVTTQRVLREEERALGLREVRGRLHQLSDQAAAERTTAKPGEHQIAERTGEAPLVERLRERLTQYRVASTWDELERRLAIDGVRLERKGQGLVITDGEREVKASRLARDFSLGQLEQRLGIYQRAAPEPGRGRPSESGPPVGIQRVSAKGASRPIDDAQVAKAVRQAQATERAAELDRAIFRATQDAEAAGKYVAGVEWAAARARATGREFDRALAGLYHRPDDARALFDSVVASHGLDSAALHLAENPRAYGELRRHERRALGVFVVPDDRKRQARVHTAVVAGRDAATASDNLCKRIQNAPPKLSRPDPGRTDAYIQAVTSGTQRASQAASRADALRAQRARFPTRVALSLELTNVARSLLPAQARRALLWLTAPQAALVQEAQNLARAVGRELTR